MSPQKADIIARLQKEILPLQGYKPIHAGSTIDAGLGPIIRAFPLASFPLGAIHEFICKEAEHIAATAGFLAGLLSALLQNGGTMIWISSSRSLFPPALKQFGIQPDRIIFLDLPKEKDLLWAMEETLKCGAVTAVVGEIPAISFTASRRLQLAVEHSQATGFLLRCKPRQLSTTACVTRWQITPLMSTTEEELPGIGFPRWKVELLKVRNGKPGNWELQWVNNRFEMITPPVVSVHELKRKAV